MKCHEKIETEHIKELDLSKKQPINFLSKTFHCIWVEEWSSWMELERGFLRAAAAGLIGRGQRLAAAAKQKHICYYYYQYYTTYVVDSSRRPLLLPPAAQQTVTASVEGFHPHNAALTNSKQLLCCSSSGVTTVSAHQRYLSDDKCSPLSIITGDMWKQFGLFGLEQRPFIEASRCRK